MLKKLLTIFLALVVILGVAMGCGEKDDVATKKPNVATPPGEFPIASEPVSLSMFVNTRLGVDSYDMDDNKFTQWLTEQTGIDLTFVVAPEQSAIEKLNVLLASGDYPDIISVNIDRVQAKVLGEQGIYLRLNDYIDEYAPTLKKILEDNPQFAQTITTPDGSIYGLPKINECYHCSFAVKMWIYKPWLDTLGLDVPETTEEFRDMLLAFKNDDPNGNGLNDEIPLMGSNKGGWNASPEGFLMNSFVYYSPKYAEGLYIDDGKVVAAYASEEWKDGLKYLNGLIEDGLMAPETYTQDNSLLLQNVERQTHIIGAVPSAYMGMFTQITTSDKWRDYVAIAPVAGPEGIRYAEYGPYDAAPLGFVITNNCEYPEVAMRLADFMYTEEATMRSVSGPLNEGFRFLEPDSGKIGIDGQPALYEFLSPIDEQPPNSSWNQMALGMRTRDFRARSAVTVAAEFEKPLEEYTETNYEPYAPPLDMIIPPIYFSEDQAADLLAIEATLKSYVEEKTATFITGTLLIDENWDKYLAELEEIGLSRLIKIYQEALDQ